MTSKESVHIPWAFSLSDAVRLPVVGEFHPLERESTKWMYWANGIAALMGLALFAAWLLWSQRAKEEPVLREIKIVHYTDLSVPPSIAKPAAPQINIEQAVAAVVQPPSIGVPEPVPDAMAWETTIATQAQMSEVLEPITMSDLGVGTGDSLVVQIPTGRSPSPDEFVVVEEEPIRISIDQPVYPEMAAAAGVEGTVLVRTLVGKDGKVKKCIVIDGHEMLKEAAIVCAKTAVFKPALLQHRPVEVWVMTPITFRLR